MMSEEQLVGEAGRRLAGDTSAWLVSHPETRNAKGEHVVIAAPRDMLVADLFERVAQYDHPVVVIYESSASRTTMVVVSTLDPASVPVEPFPAGLTVGDMDGIRTLFGDGQYIAVAKEATATPAPKASKWEHLLPL